MFNLDKNNKYTLALQYQHVLIVLLFLYYFEIIKPFFCLIIICGFLLLENKCI